jgi:hypothetical protein
MEEDQVDDSTVGDTDNPDESLVGDLVPFPTRGKPGKERVRIAVQNADGPSKSSDLNSSLNKELVKPKPVKKRK